MFRPSIYFSGDWRRWAEEKGTLVPSFLVTRRVVPMPSSTMDWFSFISKLVGLVAAYAEVISVIIVVTVRFSRRCLKLIIKLRHLGASL